MSRSAAPTIVSFYTPNWEYPAYAARLRASCARLGLPHVIEELPDRGGWLANGWQKPAFILEKMEQVQRPLLWVDADNELVGAPTGLRDDVDFMAVAREGTRYERKKEWTWCVWVMFFNPTPGAMKLLRSWASERNGTDASDDRAFERVWQRVRNEVRGAALPPEYAKKKGSIVRMGNSTWAVKKKELRAHRKARTGVAA